MRFKMAPIYMKTEVAIVTFLQNNQAQNGVPRSVVASVKITYCRKSTTLPNLSVAEKINLSYLKWFISKFSDKKVRGLGSV